ncbi:MAG TPA: ATP synthase F1 subunit gamma [Flavobacteriaceae bacterium]|nr:ATP synthase F1 subunit gamma [Flavobacteriaceae bacterium]
MANLKDIRNRINSVSSTMQITNAMKMVSAAKLNRAQDAITAMRPYSNKLTELLQSLSTAGEEGSNEFAQEREVQNVLIIPISSNRGLAGAFNTNIVKAVQALTETEFADKSIDLLAIGSKAADVLAKTQNILNTNTEIFDKLSFEEVAEIAEELMDDFLNEEYDKIIFVYNRFINAATQEVMTEQFLPIVQKETVEEEQESELDYIYEPGREQIINELIPKSLKTQLFKALRDSVAAEHGARMTAMHKATDNAEEMKDELTLSYNKARQASITNEILEIVGGAEALNN